jgi:hypothetical protein
LRKLVSAGYERLMESLRPIKIPLTWRVSSGWWHKGNLASLPGTTGGGVVLDRNTVQCQLNADQFSGEDSNAHKRFRVPGDGVLLASKTNAVYKKRLAHLLLETDNCSTVLAVSQRGSAAICWTRFWPVSR